MEEKLTLPRDAQGKVDVTATAQLLNDVVERWVREDPGQWMWFHKRWKLAATEAPQAPTGFGEEEPSLIVDGLAAVVIHHGVPRFGEEQPALDDHARELASAASTSRCGRASPARRAARAVRRRSVPEKRRPR